LASDVKRHTQGVVRPSSPSVGGGPNSRMIGIRPQSGGTVK